MNRNENPIERLLDTEDNAPIVLYDESDNGVRFEQVALIPYKEKLYALLKPIDKLPGVADDEAVIFSFEEEEDGAQYLMVVSEDPIIDDVVGIYLKLIAEESKKPAKKEPVKKESAKKAPAKKEVAKKEVAKKAPAKPAAKKAPAKPAAKTPTKKTTK